MTENTRLHAGDTAPDFTLNDQDGNQVNLSSVWGDNGEKVILYFYPAAKTPGCTKEACDFRDNMASLGAAGYRVLGVSKDSVEVLRSFADEEGLAFPLLSDTDLSVHKAYGAYGEKNLYGKTVTGVLRSTFVLDERGVITLALYNVKATGHVSSLRKKLGLDS